MVEVAVSVDIGETERVPAASEGDCTGDPTDGIDAIDGAEGGDIAAGTEARYSAP